MDLPNFSLEALINALPENRPLYKDSGLWQVRSDDMETVIYQQGANQKFPCFISGYIDHLIMTDPNFNVHDFCIDAAVYDADQPK